MRTKLNRRRQQQNQCNQEQEKGILAPSQNLFEQFDREVSLNSLKEDVITSIQNRESLIDRIRETLIKGNEGNKKGSRIGAERQSNHIKKLLFALHNASLCVVEAIITINLSSQSMECQDRNTNLSKDDATTQSSTLSSSGQGVLTFYWMGQNYLVKMMTDSQFICNFEEMMAILLPEKKTLFRNPFLIPLDLDEIVGYEPGASCSSSESKTVRMSRVTWEINLQRVKTATCRILFEEHRAVYGDSNVVHVFPKASNKKGKNIISILLPSSPILDVVDLEKTIMSIDLSFDDALVVGCVRLLLGCDIKGTNIDGDSISKQSIFKLARQPLEIIVDELHMPANKMKSIYVERDILFTIHSMIMRNLFKTEILMKETSQSIRSLKTWLIHVISREWEKNGPMKDKENVQVKHKGIEQGRRKTMIKSDASISPNVKNLSPKPSLGKEKVHISTALKQEEVKLRNSNLDDQRESKNIDRAKTMVTSEKRDNSTMLHVQNEDFSTVPIWGMFHIKEGSRKINAICGHTSDGSIGNIHVGDIIRIGHPYKSLDYTVSQLDEICFYINEAFVESPQLGQKYAHGELTTPTQSEQINQDRDSNATYQESNYTNHLEFVEKKEKHLRQTRIWKLVPNSDDKRLEWRKQYDDGLVPWIPSLQSGFREFFRIKMKLVDIERWCSDSILNPDNCAHQQRLHYFEKVSIDDIILETYRTVCQSWHPITPTIDNSKWAKLARTMKFLSSVKNSNHEVDMAFFRHSFQRKLDIKQFKSVLLDMALQRFSSARYDGGEALTNMLWTTVVMLPQVNKMIWSKAQDMAIQVELRRTCAQARISAKFRMWRQRKLYCRILSAVTCISKNVRCMIAMHRKRLTLAIADYERFYRMRYMSATICQKYWRRYRQICTFIEFKRLRRKQKEQSIADLWRNLRIKGLEKSQYLIFREVMNIQSILTITSMFLCDKMHIGKGIQLDIKVYVPQIWKTYDFSLNENDVRECLERFIVKKGPLSWNEMLRRDVLSQLRTRLVAKVVRGCPIIVFCRRDIAEKGSLISRKLFAFNSSIWILSIYRSQFDIVVRLYDPERREQLRTKIDLLLLIEWLTEDEEMKRKETLGVLRFCDMVRKKDDSTEKPDHNKTRKFIHRDDLPTLLKNGKQQDLIIWLTKRIEVQKQANGENKIVLQYEAEAEHMERVTRKFQSLWRAKRARAKAKKEVHFQYEKHFDWTSKTFFYIHKKTGVRQWSKPALLRDDEDIVDPPDEWRATEYHDPDTGNATTYYSNPFTGQTSWLSEYEAARIVQRRFRKRQTELLLPSSLNFSQVVRAVSMIRDTEIKYEQDPFKLSNRVNFALLCHCLRFDLEKARALYKDAMIKSSHHPVIARAYGIFILATCQAPLTQTFEKACQLFKRAQTIDPDQKMFDAAKEHYFYWAVLMNPNHPVALLNYALLHQCILGEFYRAEKIYRRALSQDPTNELIAHNYKLFEDQRFPGGYYAGSGVPHVIVKRSHISEEKKDWGEWKKMIDPLSTKPKFNKFWFNALDKTSTFEEPNWEEVWIKRVQRSKRISANNKSFWVEYYDDELHATFIHNRSTGEYVWQQSE